MTIKKGSLYGVTGSALADDGVVCASDAEVRRVLEDHRRRGQPLPPVGLTGGDLARTLGRSAGRPTEALWDPGRALTFPVDVYEVLLDGRLHLFCAHLIARNRTWTLVAAAMGAQWRANWNLGPRAHPNDGLLDIYQGRLRLGDLAKIRRRLPTGSHLPLPGVTQRRTAAYTVELERPLRVELDGEAVGHGRILMLRVRPDALTVVI